MGIEGWGQAGAQLCCGGRWLERFRGWWQWVVLCWKISAKVNPRWLLKSSLSQFWVWAGVGWLLECFWIFIDLNEKGIGAQGYGGRRWDWIREQYLNGIDCRRTAGNQMADYPRWKEDEGNLNRERKKIWLNSRNHQCLVGFQMVAWERLMVGQAFQSGRLIEIWDGVPKKWRRVFTSWEDEEDERTNISRSRDSIGVVGWFLLGIYQKPSKKSYRVFLQVKKNYMYWIELKRDLQLVWWTGSNSKKKWTSLGVIQFAKVFL